MENPTGKVTETVVYLNKQPIYSGSKFGANSALIFALQKHNQEGRPEPSVKITERTVDYDLPDQDQNKVTEKEVTL